jgi:hypothetical protein
MTQDEALRKAINAFEVIRENPKIVPMPGFIEKLKKALVNPQKDKNRTWVGLTDEEVEVLIRIGKLLEVNK